MATEPGDLALIKERPGHLRRWAKANGVVETLRYVLAFIDGEAV